MPKNEVAVIDRKLQKKFPPWKCNGGTATVVKTKRDKADLRKLTQEAIF